MLIKMLYHLGDTLEDKVRGFLSRYPIAYALISGAAVIIFWRGVWHTWDYLAWSFGIYGTSEVSLWDGPVAIIAGTIVLLLTGILVSEFIGEKIIISGLKGEKKVADKTREEIEAEESTLRKIERRLEKIESGLGPKT